jgi:hypothetical protein
MGQFIRVDVKSNLRKHAHRIKILATENDKPHWQELQPVLHPESAATSKLVQVYPPEFELWSGSKTDKAARKAYISNENATLNKLQKEGGNKFRYMYLTSRGLTKEKRSSGWFYTDTLSVHFNDIELY